MNNKRLNLNNPDKQLSDMEIESDTSSISEDSGLERSIKSDTEEEIYNKFDNYKNYGPRGYRLQIGLCNPNELVKQYKELSSSPAFKTALKTLKELLVEELKLMNDNFERPAEYLSELEYFAKNRYDIVKEFDEALPDFNEISNISIDQTKKLAKVTSKVSVIMGEDYRGRIEAYTVDLKRIIIDRENELENKLLIFIMQLGSSFQNILDTVEKDILPNPNIVSHLQSELQS